MKKITRMELLQKIVKTCEKCKPDDMSCMIGDSLSKYNRCNLFDSWCIAFFLKKNFDIHTE